MSIAYVSLIKPNLPATQRIVVLCDAPQPADGSGVACYIVEEPVLTRRFNAEVGRIYTDVDVLENAARALGITRLECGAKRIDAALLSDPDAIYFLVAGTDAERSALVEAALRREVLCTPDDAQRVQLARCLFTSK